MRELQEIEDEEHEQLVERVAAVDVAKASGMVCTRVPHPSRPGRRRTRVQEVDATTNAIIELGGQLAAEGIEKVTIESTSDYWRPFFYLLEAAGLAVQLVNAHDVKNAPGRPKTDKPQCCSGKHTVRQANSTVTPSASRRRISLSEGSPRRGALLAHHTAGDCAGCASLSWCWPFCR
jgi:hypothetical protein